MISEGTTTKAGEPSSQSSLPKDLLFLDSQLGKRVHTLCTILTVVANVEVMIAESTGLAPVEEPMASTGVEDNTLRILTAEPELSTVSLSLRLSFQRLP